MTAMNALIGLGYAILVVLVLFIIFLLHILWLDHKYENIFHETENPVTYPPEYFSEEPGEQEPAQ